MEEEAREVNFGWGRMIHNSILPELASLHLLFALGTSIAGLRNIDRARTFSQSNPNCCSHGHATELLGARPIPGIHLRVRQARRPHATTRCVAAQVAARIVRGAQGVGHRVIREGEERRSITGGWVQGFGCGGRGREGR